MNLNGTVVDLTSNLRFNGRELSGVEFGTLVKVLGDAFATKTGSVKKDGARGKPATIWTISADSPILVTEAVAADSADNASNAGEDVTSDASEGSESTETSNPDDVTL